MKLVAPHSQVMIPTRWPAEERFFCFVLAFRLVADARIELAYDAYETPF
jgi:hypothetical protein